MKVVSHKDEVLNNLDRALRQASEAIGQKMESHAKEKTPVDTGRLRNSITHGYDLSEKEIYVGSDVEYAPYIELGSRGRHAHHMLERSITEHGDEYKNLLRAALEANT